MVFTPDEPVAHTCGTHHGKQHHRNLLTTPPQRRFYFSRRSCNVQVQNLSAGKLRLSIVSVKYQTQYIVPFRAFHVLPGKWLVLSVLRFNTLGYRFGSGLFST